MLRGIVGGVLGAVVAAIVLRIRSVVRTRQQPIGEVLADLPGILADDVTRIGDAARSAVADGREATDRARIEFDEQVARHARRTEGNDV